MIKPDIVSPDDEVEVVAEVFSTPLVVKGSIWFPLTQLAAWPIMARIAKNRVPTRTWLQSMGIAALTMPVVLGSEWGHNLAHAAAARLVGKPMDAIRITWGMPLVVYHDINDPDVTPKQHIFRSLGGPIFNLLLLPFALLFRRFTRPNSSARDVADTAVGVNIFLPAVGLLPIPGIDGGPILKWSLVSRGKSIPQADRTVRKVNGLLSAILTFAGFLSFKNNRRWLGGFLTLLGATALGVASGFIKEQEKHKSNQIIPIQL